MPLPRLADPVPPDGFTFAGQADQLPSGAFQPGPRVYRCNRCRSFLVSAPGGGPPEHHRCYDFAKIHLPGHSRARK